MKKTGKDQDASIAVPRLYQQVFVAAVISGWIAEMLAILHGFIHAYISAGTWTFQIIMWFYPVLYFLFGMAFTAPRYTGWLRRSFMATLLTVAGVSVYTAIDLMENVWYSGSYTKAHPLIGDSLWSAFGNEWIVMAVSLVLYVGSLWWLKGKKTP